MNRMPPSYAILGWDRQGRAKEAFRAALDLHRKFATRIEVVHAVPLPAPDWVAGDPVELTSMRAEILADARKHVEGDLGRILKAESVDLDPAEILFVSDEKAAKTIVERERAQKADLIVLGPHQKRGFLDFGRTARAVISQTAASIWTQPGEYKPVRRMLVPIDLSPESLEALVIARNLASGFGADMTILHCFMPPGFADVPTHGYPAGHPTYVIDACRDAARTEFERTMEDLDWRGFEGSKELRFEEGEPYDVILEEQDNFDLIAMGTHGRSGLAAAVLGNVAYRVLKDAQIPVFAIRHTGRKWAL